MIDDLHAEMEVGLERCMRCPSKMKPRFLVKWVSFTDELYILASCFLVR